MLKKDCDDCDEKDAIFVAGPAQRDFAQIIRVLNFTKQELDDADAVGTCCVRAHYLRRTHTHAHNTPIGPDAGSMVSDRGESYSGP